MDNTNILNTMNNEPSVNFREWQENNKEYFAIARKDKFNPEYGWILAIGPAEKDRIYRVTENEALLYDVPLEELVALQALDPQMPRRVLHLH